MVQLHVSGQSRAASFTQDSTSLKAISADRAEFSLKGQRFTIGKSIYTMTSSQQHLLVDLLSPKQVKNFVFESKGDHKVATYAAVSAATNKTYFVTLKTGAKNDVHSISATPASFESLLNGLDDTLSAFSAFFVKEKPQAILQQPAHFQAGATMNPNDLHVLVNDGDVMFVGNHAYVAEPLNETGSVNRLIDSNSQSRVAASLALMQGENPQEALAAYALGRHHQQDQAELKALKEGLRQQAGSGAVQALVGKKAASINGLSLMSELEEEAQMSSPIQKQALISAFLNKDRIVVDDAMPVNTALSYGAEQGLNNAVASVHLFDDAPVKKNVHSSLLQEASQPDFMLSEEKVLLVLNAQNTNCTMTGFGMKDDGANVQMVLAGRHMITPQQAIRTQDGYVLIGDITHSADKPHLKDANAIQQGLLHGYA